VVGLVDRAVQSGLVTRTEDAADRRVVVVSLTERGEDILSRLSVMHRAEVKRLRQEFLRVEAGADDAPADRKSKKSSSAREKRS
jgi:DNA-binding MarR family transcriptional regulator